MIYALIIYLQAISVFNQFLEDYFRQYFIWIFTCRYLLIWYYLWCCFIILNYVGMRFFVLYLVEGDIGYRCLKKKILMGAKFCWPISYNVNSHFGHGLPEGDTRQPTSHRCNDRAEDVIQVSLVYISFLFFSFFVVFSFCFSC